MTETKEWDDDKIEREAIMAADAYCAVMNKTVEKFGGFPPDFYQAGRVLGDRLSLEWEHAWPFITGILDGSVSEPGGETRC